MKRCQTGKYKLKNPSKYRGKKSDIVFRSSWEKKCFHYLDMNPNIIWWSSEELQIHYICPTDDQPHRYFPDLIFETKEKKIYVIEIKPHAQTTPPRKSSNKEKYLTEVLTFGKNQAKWNAANDFCESKGWNFRVWTEHHLKKLGLKL